ncbi:hypothetical protein ACH4UV_32965 [Streptomyces sp. NPDC020802]|uniref:hypothetical protein n=1 Tax=Streptomyces sp. NPDC020802 TaxID=3365094 RepID=UPI0037A5299C
MQRQIEAQHIQADRQRRFEHSRDRREPRSQAYADLVAQTQHVGTLISVMNQTEEYTTASVHEASEQITKLLRCRARVVVEGPVVVAKSTEDLVEAIVECREVLATLTSLPGAPPELQGLSRTQLTELCRQGLESIAECLATFVEEARQALDDNGTA